MRKYLFITGLVFLSAVSFAQGPAITRDLRPEDGDGIYVEPIAQTKDWDDFNGGFKKGRLMPDLTFYTLDGEQVTLSTVLKETRKPVLLVSGNYSCPVFRRTLADLNSMTKFYKDRLNVYIIYTLEAHPVTGIQAYPLIPPAVKKNEADNINMKQASRYIDRRRAVAKMNKKLDILPTVLLDGPYNEWWSNSGCAPNNAYLVNTQGVIVAKNGWFNKSMWSSIDKLLHTRSGNCVAKKG